MTLGPCRYILPKRDRVTGRYQECGKPATEQVMHAPFRGSERYEKLCARHAAAAVRRKWYGNSYRER